MAQVSKCTLTREPCGHSLGAPGETELGSAGTQPNEGYLGRGCAKVHPAADGGTSPAAVVIDGKPWTPALCLKKIPRRSRVRKSPHSDWDEAQGCGCQVSHEFQVVLPAASRYRSDPTERAKGWQVAAR